ncbi:MAG: hypothetical protein K2O04_05075 [Clostridiales bacterium]|nr:hypothetical protein [Clostridiales bacterium]
MVKNSPLPSVSIVCRTPVKQLTFTFLSFIIYIALRGMAALTCPGEPNLSAVERGGVKRLRLLNVNVHLKIFYEVVFDENINGKKDKFQVRRLQDRGQGIQA